MRSLGSYPPCGLKTPAPNWAYPFWAYLGVGELVVLLVVLLVSRAVPGLAMRPKIPLADGDLDRVGRRREIRISVCLRFVGTTSPDRMVMDLRPRCCAPSPPYRLS